MGLTYLDDGGLKLFVLDIERVEQCDHSGSGWVTRFAVKSIAVSPLADSEPIDSAGNLIPPCVAGSGFSFTPPSLTRHD
jgi:hypothetical protein